MSLKGKLEIVAQTDVGRVRDHNEDFISCEEGLGVAVLADGMGGLNAGEVASSMTVHLLMDDLVAYREGSTALRSELGDIDDSDVPLEASIVKFAIEKANSAVFHTSQTQPQCRGMGTTVIAGLFWNNRVSIGHIGDSRVYRFRDDCLEQITKDHSFVQELLDKGLVTKEEARNSDRKNVVTRALGVAPNVEAEVNEFKTRVGDIYLMCSDGLTDLVTDDDIEKSVSELNGNLGELAAHLINISNVSGGKDNISVILVRVLKPFPARSGVLKKIVNWFE
jgi:protein phosphatase